MTTFDRRKRRRDMRIPFYHVRPPVRCSTLRDIATRAHGSWDVLAGAHAVRHRLPPCSPEVRAFFAPHEVVTFGPTAVATIPGGRVFGQGVVISPDGATVARDVSVVFGGPDDDHWVGRAGKLRRPTRVRGALLVVASAGAEGYYHWLLDELPRLLVAAGQRTDYVLATKPTGFLKAAAPHLDLPSERWDAEGFSHYQCDRLFVPTYVGHTGQPDEMCVGLLRDFGDKVLRNGPPTRTPEKLYISRRSAPRRRTTNEDELSSALGSRGFHRVELESVSWVEQVALFRHARVIVAPHGAGLSNLVFARAGCRVVEFFHRRYMHWCYWQIASLNELDYRPVVADGDDVLRHDMASGGCDITADVAAVCRVVDES